MKDEEEDEEGVFFVFFSDPANQRDRWLPF